MNNILQALLLIVFPLLSLCQDVPLRKKAPLEFTIYGGGQVLDITNINGRLSSLNLSKESPFLIIGGFGMSYRISNIILGYTIEGGASASSDHHITSANANAYISTNAIRVKNLILSPQTGIGGQVVTIKLAKQGTATSFDQYLTTASNQTEITNTTVVLDLGLTLKYADPDTKRIYPFFRVGYRYGLEEKPWTVVNASSVKGPSDRLSNFYFQLLLGVGR